MRRDSAGASAPVAAGPLPLTTLSMWSRSSWIAPTMCRGLSGPNVRPLHRYRIPRARSPNGAPGAGGRCTTACRANAVGSRSARDGVITASATGVGRQRHDRRRRPGRCPSCTAVGPSMSSTVPRRSHSTGVVSLSDACTRRSTKTNGGSCTAGRSSRSWSGGTSPTPMEHRSPSRTRRSTARCRGSSSGSSCSRSSDTGSTVAPAGLSRAGSLARVTRRDSSMVGYGRAPTAAGRSVRGRRRRDTAWRSVVGGRVVNESAS